MRIYKYLVPVWMLVVACASPASAAPYVPTSDATVLERLPFKANAPIARDLAQLRAQLRDDPKNVDAAVRLAQRYYSLVAEEGDPRFTGYAQAALAPWWDMPQPPLEVQVMRASLNQFRHDFSGALQDLSDVLARAPKHAQARALRATIHIVQARYAQARADCSALHGVTSRLLAVGCEAMVDGLTGHAAAAYDRLKRELESSAHAGAGEKLWVQIRLAEIAQRLGNMERAEAHFKQALSLQITDTFLLAAYADFLLDQQRPQEVVRLLQDRVPSDVLLLRLVLAENVLRAATVAERIATLSARYAAAQMRGDTVHQQEEARFALHVQHDAKNALRLALENWAVQREPRDARIVLEAALAQKNRDAAQPVLQWLSESKHEDRVLLDLARQLSGAQQ